MGDALVGKAKQATLSRLEPAAVCTNGDHCGRKSAVGPPPRLKSLWTCLHTVVRAMTQPTWRASRTANTISLAITVKCAAVDEECAISRRGATSHLQCTHAVVYLVKRSIPASKCMGRSGMRDHLQTHVAATVNTMHGASLRGSHAHWASLTSHTATDLLGGGQPGHQDSKQRHTRRRRLQHERHTRVDPYTRQGTLNNEPLPDPKSWWLSWRSCRGLLTAIASELPPL
jgi:hypothetical protein